MRKKLFILLIINTLCANLLAQSNALSWYKNLPSEWQKAFVYNKCDIKTAASIQFFLDTTADFTLYFELETNKIDTQNADKKHIVKDLKPLLKFKKLTKLYANEIEVKTYADLRCMSKLLLLEVQTSSFGNADMKYLKKMKGLKRLNIAQTTVSSLKPLVMLKNLEIVLCMETAVPREKIKEMAAFLPKNCRIIRDYL